jgi:hypothetical protein
LCIARCIEQVKNSQYLELAHDLEIDKAIMFLKLKDFQQVKELLFLVCSQPCAFIISAYILGLYIHAQVVHFDKEMET